MVPAHMTCGIKGRLTLLPNVHLQGSDGATIKLLANVHDYAILGVAASNSGLADLSVDAGDYDGGPNSAAVAWVNSNGVFVRRVLIVNQGRFGIVLNGGTSYDFPTTRFPARRRAPRSAAHESKIRPYSSPPRCRQPTAASPSTP